MVPSGRVCPFMSDSQKLVFCAVKCIFAFDVNGKTDCLLRRKLQKELNDQKAEDKI